MVISPTQDAQDGTTYPISWQSEAGTVYGGTVDLVSGVLIVTHGYVDLGTLDWAKGTASGVTEYHAVIGDKENAANNTGIITAYKMLSENAAGAPAARAMLANNDKCAVLSKGTSQPYVYIRDDTYTSASEFKTGVSGVMLVYELAAPQTYQLTPTEVRSLLGLNNVWVDTGDVEVQYRADTKLYIDGKNTDFSKLIAPTEAAYTATRAYTSGSLLIVGNQLYKATTSIANGATLTVGTNITATTLAEVIAAL